MLDRPYSLKLLSVRGLPWREYAEEFASAKARMSENEAFLHLRLAKTSEMWFLTRPRVRLTLF